MRVIAIDGPAGSGKTSVAQALAARLSLEYLDTGAMYRAVTFAVLRAGGDPSDGGFTAAVARTIDLRVTGEQVLVGGVVEGRDIGTVVFPEAALKVYLKADPDVRALRRARQSGALDHTAGAGTVESVAADLARRDTINSSRRTGPLAVASDAVVIDTTTKTFDETIEQIMGLL